MTKERKRLLAGLAATAVVLLPLAWFWQQSLVPSTYSVMDMGYVDYGGGPKAAGHGAHGGHHGGTSVKDLVADPQRKADVTVDLVARQGKTKLASGREIDGYTINGRTPGPTVTATQGQLVEVHLRNASVEGGVSLHWHGVDVPNAEDGVAGVTQDAVSVGRTHTYRFVADQVGTFWYHSHQVSHEQVIGGLFGALTIHPKPSDAEAMQDVVGLAHTYNGTRTIDGEERVTRVPAKAGENVRVRLINTDNGTMPVWASQPFRVVSIDAGDLNEPTPVDGTFLRIPAGGRADLVVQVPASGAARVQVAAATAFVIGPDRAKSPARPVQPKDELDLSTYGTPKALPFDVKHPDRTFDYSIGRRPGFLDGKPGLWWSINGHLWPDVPMFTVREGDVVKFHIENHSGEVHPMHLHGHHAVVVARNSKPAKGSPVWVDSIDVEDNETVDIVFKADNPGVWMDHCHNLPHAAQGLVAHLMYEGVSTPFKVGGNTDNKPE
ncbi:multicopper oxidase family protein [Aeromicrobium sp.]|uniref:multicopper oxidase family protein n=1 Tax=Aeromicrobium sp. TaxID=1871063 RepID=UPI003C3A89FA